MQNIIQNLGVKSKRSLGTTTKCAQVHARWPGVCVRPSPSLASRKHLSSRAEPGGWLCAPCTLFLHCGHTHSNPPKVSRAGALPVVELWPPDIKWNVVPSCKMGREGSQGHMIVNILLLLSSNWENTKCQKLWQWSNVFQYLNHNNIYMHQKKKLCAYVPNII